MPELLEVEIYRQLAARTIGRTIAAVETPDAWFLRRSPGGGAIAALVIGSTVTDTRRRGKLLLMDLHDGPTLGLRFGMTGRLLVDDDAAIERLEYGSSRAEPAWDRFTLRFVGGGSLVLRDPRRLGGVELDPEEDRLGPDATTVGAAALRTLLGRSKAPLKARLLDQRQVAGLGNLLTDEVLWRARLDPRRPAGELDDNEVRRLHRALRTTLRTLSARGGSHTGDLQVARQRGGRCPRCGAELRRDTIGGRTTYWCSVEQG